MSVDYYLFAATESDLRLACEGWGDVNDEPGWVEQYSPMELRNVRVLRYLGQRAPDPVPDFPLQDFPHLRSPSSPYGLFELVAQRRASEQEEAALFRKAYLPHDEGPEAIYRLPTFLVQLLQGSTEDELKQVREFLAGELAPGVLPFIYAGI